MTSKKRASQSDLAAFLAELDSSAVTEATPPSGTHEILPGKLWTASASRCDILKATRPATPWAVISLTDSPDDDGGPLRPAIHWPVQDRLVLPDEGILSLVAEWGVAAINAGRVLIVQCQAGNNRAGLLCGVILHRLGDPDPLATLRAANPLALSGNRVFREYVQSLTTEKMAEVAGFLRELDAAKRRA
jgi:hypothetical protein